MKLHKSLIFTLAVNSLCVANIQAATQIEGQAGGVLYLGAFCQRVSQRFP
jgi:hypothetical protein